jgi:hypothetical protein
MKWIHEIKQDYQGWEAPGIRVLQRPGVGRTKTGRLRAVWNLRGIAVVTHDCFPYEVGGAPGVES